MKWFKHPTDSYNDPDISDAEDLFGDAGYTVFFKVLEIYGREFNKLNSEGKLRISRTFIRRKLRKSWTKVEQILNFYSKRKRMSIKIDGDFIELKVPKFIVLASNWTKRNVSNEVELPTEAPTEAPTAIEEEKKKKGKEKKSIKKKKPFSIPENYKLDQKHIQYAVEKEIPQNAIKDIFEGFKIHHRKKGTQYVDWYASWQYWVRNHLKFQKRDNSKSVSNPDYIHVDHKTILQKTKEYLKKYNETGCLQYIISEFKQTQEDATAFLAMAKERI